MNKPSYHIDIAVLVIFFVRDEPFAKTFEQVKRARPSRLYLYQDGPREGRPEDARGIERCRKIVAPEEIDWECQVHRLYQDKNLGCDPSEYIAQKWMFETEEMGIILEDDDVASPDFFPFCRELLEKYRNDQRINMICGMNNTGVSEHTPYSYMFSTTGAITGWATWKRVVDEWTDRVGFVEDAYAVRQFKDRYKPFMDTAAYISHCRRCNDSGIAHYEAILSSNALMNSRLNIVPKWNLISNIGVVADATHSVADLRMLPRGIRRIFHMQTYELEFPLCHPPMVIEDMQFKKRLDRIMANGHPFIRLFRRCESVVLRLRHGDFRGLRRSLWRVLRRRKA